MAKYRQTNTTGRSVLPINLVEIMNSKCVWNMGNFEDLSALVASRMFVKHVRYLDHIKAMMSARLLK